MSGSIALLVVSPRVPAGLMTRDAWRRLESADAVLGRAGDEPLVEVTRDEGFDVEIRDEPPAARHMPSSRRGSPGVTSSG